jgi:hypothetical protein
VSLAGLVSALYAAIDALSPTSVAERPWTRARGVSSPSALIAAIDALPTRSVWLEVGPPTDTGLLIAPEVAEVAHECVLHALYRDSELAWSDDADIARMVTYEDARALIAALRPASVWAAESTSVVVYPETTVDEVADDDGRIIGRVLRVRLTVEVAT